MDFSGYGFDLNVTKEEPSLIISGLVNNSPAGRTGLKLGDRIVEVNGNNVERESNLKVVHKILKKSDSVWLLMLDAAAVAYYKERNITVRGDMSNVVTTYCPDTSEGIATSLISGERSYSVHRCNQLFKLTLSTLNQFCMNHGDQRVHFNLKSSEMS